jgi:hypothetical protein
MDNVLYYQVSYQATKKITVEFILWPRPGTKEYPRHKPEETSWTGQVYGSSMDILQSAEENVALR